MSAQGSRTLMNPANNSGSVTDNKPRPNPLMALSFAGSGLFLFVLYFLELGRFPLIDPDEPIYGQVAQEMARGDWLTPHLNGALWFDKPPLFYWLSAAGVRFLGANEFACRLPSALLGVGLVGLTYALAVVDFGRRAATLCAVVMATCLLQIALARTAVTDMTFAFCLTLALLCYRRWLACDVKGDKRHALMWALSCGAATGLATLAKGPVAPLLLSLTFGIHLGWTKKLESLRGIAAPGAVLMALLVGLPWYLAMLALHGHDFVQGFLVANNLTRFAKAEHSHGDKWYANLYNVPVLFAFFFPWSVFLPQALTRAWRKSRTKNHAARAETALAGNGLAETADEAACEKQRDGTRLALTWFGVVFVFFTLSRTQLVTYTFPLYPAAALLVGVLWNEAETSAREAVAIARGLRWGLGVEAALVLLAALAVLPRSAEYGTRTLVIGSAAILLLACIFAWRALPRGYNSAAQHVAEKSVGRTFQSGVWALGSGIACLLLWMLPGLSPQFMEGKSTREIVRRLPLQQADVVSFDVRDPSLMFYAKWRPHIRFSEAATRPEVTRALSRATPVFVICKRKNVNLLLQSGVVEWMAQGNKVVLANAPAAALPIAVSARAGTRTSASTHVRRKFSF